MNLGKIEENVQKLTQQVSQGEFIYELLLAYGLPKASITLLKDGAYNLSKRSGEILWKKKLLFREVFDQDLHATIDQLCRDETTAKHNPRFIIVTDYKTFLAYDTKTKDTLDTPLVELHRHFDFFFPWSGREKAQAKLENPADVKAAERMAKLYDNIRQDNPHQFLNRESLHELNVFLSRLLFCYFAEDTEIFPKKLFVNSVESHTHPDGSDLAEYLDRLFLVLNTQHTDRNGLPDYLKKFEYVNGGLFEKAYKAPKFTARSRKLLLECGKLDWSEINPDIFGSMIQAVVHPDQRGGMGMHYTSVSNIMKVIEPLFLNELHEEFENNQNNPQKLEKLLGRLSTIRIFDPACGSGNFLIIAYKELRLLEIKILKQSMALSDAVRGFADVQASLIPKAQMSLAGAQLSLFSRINLSQFYGIELDDFAHEIAILSLWLAEHQMNVKFNEEFKKKLSALPLKQGGKIIWENATRINWEDVCPKDDKYEIYILGNPPYLGSRNQKNFHKEDMKAVFQNVTKGYKNLDYIAAWFYKGAEYVKNARASLGFVSTNSICQGDQVALLWPHIFQLQLEIGFCHQAFKWANNAKKNAGVICVIINLRNVSNRNKEIYLEGNKQIVSNINPYLTSGSNIIVTRKSRPNRHLPPMLYGNEPRENGHLLLTVEEKCELLALAPSAPNLLKRVSGSREFIRGIERWCLWISDKQFREAREIPFIAKRLEKVTAYRKTSERADTVKMANEPHRFTSITYKETPSIIVPIVSSERREYLPLGFLDGSEVILNSAQAIYDAEPYVFGILSSRMHIIWVKAVAGRLKTDFRYSSAICYNTFPVPDISQKQKETITTHAFNILEEREKHPEKTMAQLYDPKKMPKGLREAHEGLDQAIERCYRAKPFTRDEERLEHLFKLYEEMTSEKKKKVC